MADVQIPGKAVLTTDDGKDILKPLNNLLEGLNLKGNEKATEDAGKPTAVFGGPPQSVALIEAGATALSKWWATGLGATVVATWSTVFGWWGKQDAPIKEVVLWAAAIVTAAAILGIAYLLGSDVRGRSAASVATIQARCQLGNSFVQAAQAAFKPSPPAPSAQIVALPAPLQVIPKQKSPDEDSGWRAVALSSNANNITEYLLAKGDKHEWVPATEVILVPAVPVQVELLPTTPRQLSGCQLHAEPVNQMTAFGRTAAPNTTKFSLREVMSNIQASQLHLSPVIDGRAGLYALEDHCQHLWYSKIYQSNGLHRVALWCWEAASSRIRALLCHEARRSSSGHWADIGQILSP